MLMPVKTLWFALTQGYLTINCRAFPGRNFGTFLAGMVIFLPVTGFTPILLFLLSTVKVPKPVSTTGLPCLREPPTVAIKASKHSLHVDLGNFVTLAMCSMSFALFIQIPLIVLESKQKLVLGCTLKNTVVLSSLSYHFVIKKERHVARKLGNVFLNIIVFIRSS